MQPLLAIDPGVNTGIAFSDASGAISFATWQLTGSGGPRLDRLFCRLNSLHARHTFARVAYERVYQGPRAGAVEVLRHFEAIILLWAARADIECLAFNPTEIKRSVCTGSATKSQVTERVRWLGHKVETEHEADAVALLTLLMSGALPAEQTRKAATKRLRAIGNETNLFGSRLPTKRR